MDLALNTVKTGFTKAIKTTLKLMKVVLPVYALAMIIKYSPIMDLLQSALQPAMSFFNLPADASISLITSLFSDEYSVIAVASQFEFTSWELTTIAMICLACHSLPVEYALSKRIGLPAGKLVIYRMFAATIIGAVMAGLGGFFQ